jgi:hypothetical protein
VSESLTVLALAVLLGGQVPALVQVEQSELVGRSLILQRFNVAVDAPADGWHWLKATPRDGQRTIGTTYVCEQTATGRRLALIVVDAVIDNLDAAGIVGSMVERAQQDGWAVEASGSNVSDTPHPGSVHGFWRGRRPDGPLVTTHVCVVAARRGYLLQYQGPEDAEPADFRAFVESFRTLRPVLPRGAYDFLRVFTYYLLLGTGAVVAVLLNLAFKGRKWLNPGTLALILAAAFLVVRLCILCLHGITIKPSTGVSPRDIAGAVGESLTPLAIGAAAWFFFAWRHRSSRSRTSPVIPLSDRRP